MGFRLGAWLQAACALALLLTAACGETGPQAPSLPFATEGRDEVEEDGDIRRFVLNIAGDGRVYFKHHEFDLTTKADDAKRALLNAVRDVHGDDPSLLVRLNSHSHSHSDSATHSESCDLRIGIGRGIGIGPGFTSDPRLASHKEGNHERAAA